MIHCVSICICMPFARWLNFLSCIPICRYWVLKGFPSMINSTGMPRSTRNFSWQCPVGKKEQESNWEKGLQVGICGKTLQIWVYAYLCICSCWCFFVQKSSLDKWHHFKYKHLYIFQNVKTGLFPTNWSLLQLNTFFVVGWLCRPCIACIRYPEKVRMVDWLVATEGATGGSKRIDKKHEVCLFNGKTNHFCCDLSLQLEICNF